MKNSISENHSNYLTSKIKVGFTDQFPETGEVIDEIEIKDKCFKFDVSFKVRYCKVSFGNGEHKITAIVTDRVKLPESEYFLDAAETMQRAVVFMAKKHGLIISNKICSYPFSKALVYPFNSTS